MRYSLLRTAMVAAVAGLAGLAPAVLIASPGPAEADGGPESITLTGPSYRVLPGQVQLAGTTGPAAEVQLWSAPYSGGAEDWIEGATTMSSSTGAFGFAPVLSTTGRQFMVNAGETASGPLAVRLDQAPTLSGASSTPGIAALRVANGVPRMSFVIQRFAGAGWTAVFTGTLMSTGTFYKALPAQASGRTIGYRIYVYGNSAEGVGSAYSPARYVRIR